MEIYNQLNTPASKEFEKLLNNKLSKTKIEEGKIIEGKITKITEKFVFLFIEGLKSEPILDINELKSLQIDKTKLTKEGEKETAYMINDAIGAEVKFLKAQEAEEREKERLKRERFLLIKQIKEKQLKEEIYY